VIIVYDGNRIEANPYIFKENEKNKEYIYKCNGISGNGQRNYALTKITNLETLLYHLDDDNILHPDLYNLLNFLDNNTIYSFNQYNRIKGNNINVGYIDTAMVIYMCVCVCVCVCIRYYICIYIYIYSTY